MPYLLDLLYSQLLVHPPTQTTPFTNQTIIVTGSNTGLGLAAARQLMHLDAAKVILAVRTLSKGEAAAAEIAASTNLSPSRIEVWHLDMSNHTSIKSFAARAATLPRLDAAILNAGVFNFQRTEVDGTESHLAINVLGTLLPTLQRSAARTGQRGRMTLVGSDMMYTVKPADFQTPGSIFAHLNTPGALPEGNYYAYSKWLLYQASRRIAALNPVSEESDVVITVQTPGACKSDLFREDSGFLFRAVSWVMFAVFARTTETGANTLVHAVRPGLGREAHGGFLMDCMVQVPKYSVADTDPVVAEVAEKWNGEVCAMIDEIVPGVMGVGS